MAEEAPQQPNIKLGTNGDSLLAVFVPPTPKGTLFEATTAAFPLSEISHDSVGRVHAVKYKAQGLGLNKSASRSDIERLFIEAHQHIAEKLGYVLAKNEVVQLTQPSRSQ